MIIRTNGGNQELRAAPVAPFSQFLTSSGLSAYSRGVTVPAIAAAVRLISETIGSFVMRVYTGDASSRQPVLDAPQAALFQRPSYEFTSFDLWQDVAASIELYGNAFIWKTITSKGVEALAPVSPDFVKVEVLPTGERKISAWVNGSSRDVTNNVLHIRGWSESPGDYEGTNTLDLHRTSVKSSQSYEEYRGKYFANDARPGLIITAAGSLTKEQQYEILRSWKLAHMGPSKANIPAVLPNNLSVSYPPSMRESQGAETSDELVKDVARMFGIRPVQLLAVAIDGSDVDVEAVSDAFHRFTLLPRLRRIERALSNDRDLFPDPTLYARFDTSEFVRGSIATQADKAHKLVQVGALTANEARAELGYPPHPDGETLQQTPVGGKPNNPDTNNSDNSGA